MAPQDGLVDSTPAPDLKIPNSSHTVKVSCIDSTSRIHLPTKVIVKPFIKDHTIADLPSWSFLVEHEASEKKILFDLGVPKDLKNTAGPSLAKRLEKIECTCEVEEDMADILKRNDCDLDSINAIIWSHHHWDHVGIPSNFPKSTDLVVGPGFKNKYLPGYPTNQESPLRDSWWEGRQLVEIDIAAEGKGLRVGRFEAFDYFGDGSFYLLHTPGHSTGHLCGLARTTADDKDGDTFVFMGGDACHHGGEFRPTEYLPLPRELQSTQLKHRSVNCPCPGELFLHQAHPTQKPTEPFYQPSDAISEDTEAAKWTIAGVEEFDASDNVLVAIAHDPSLLGQIDLYPRSMNGWKARKEREKVLWRFLEDFEVKQ